jgi:hypothetical protein
LRAEETAPPATSLFFTEQESEVIANRHKKPPPIPETVILRLGSILYFGPKDWIVWLQGERWTPDTDKPDLHIVSVDPEQVRLIWTAGTTQPQSINLRPHQTYNTATGQVSDGE